MDTLPSSLLPSMQAMRNRRWLPWLPWLLLAICLHFFAIKLANLHLRIAFAPQTPPGVLSVDLRAPAPTVEPPPPVPAPNRRPDAPVHRPAVTVLPMSEEAPARPEPGAKQNAATNASVQPAASSQQGALLPTAYPFEPPPSSRLLLTVRSTGLFRESTGTGHLIWVSSNRRYANVTGELLVPGRPPMRFQSNALLTQEHGIVPRFYSEKRGDEAESIAQFQHKAKTLIFSQSSRTLPLSGGEQDAVSVIWQLAGIARHDLAGIQPGAQFRFVVASTTDASIWLFTALGLEDLETPLGKLQAWRLRRTPPPGSREQTVDLWLAPQHGWLPIWIRHTEHNGDTLDLIVTNITPEPDT